MLIYRKHPFRKKEVFAKGKVEEYEKGEYELDCNQEKYKSLNIFIRRCLPRSKPNEQPF